MQTWAAVPRIRSELARLGDPDKAKQQQAYMKSAMPYRGVAVPAVRKLVTATIREHGLPEKEQWLAAIRQLWDEANYREERYAALALLRSAKARTYRDPSLWPDLEHFITTGAWWDLVDETSHVVGELLLGNPSVAARLRRWAVSDDIWLRRSSIIAQLDAGERTDLALLRDVIEANAAETEFFIAKAIGWALRQYARQDADWVRSFVAEHDLRPLSRREALRHIGATS